MSFITDIEQMPTNAKLVLAGAVVAVGVFAYFTFKKSGATASSSGTTSGTTAGSSPGTGQQDQFVANGQAAAQDTDQRIYNLIQGKSIDTNFAKIEAELASLQKEMPPVKPHGGGNPLAPQWGIVSRVHAYHPLQSATIASKRPVSY